jgi:hypothetical protein
MTAFYRELARRALNLANALQYENAETLLRLANCEAEALPGLLGDAQAEMTFAFIFDPYDHDQFQEGVALLERYLEETA